MTKLEKLIEELCPNGVEKYTLSDVTLKFTDGMHNLPKTTMEISDYRILSAQNIFNGCIDLTTTKFVSEEVFKKENKRTDVKKGDVLLTIVGAIGRVTVVEDDLYALFQRSVCVIKPDNSKIISKYLQYVLESNNAQAFIKLNAHGAAQKGIYLKDVGNIPVFLPPLEVQAEIVKILDDYSTSVTALQQELEKELTARKKQYEYYRDGLLTLENADTKTIGQVSAYRRGSFPQPYGNKEWYDGDGAMPFVQVADIGEDMRLVEDTKRKISVIAQPKSVFAPKGSIIISLQGSIGRIAVTQYDAYIDRTVAIFNEISKELLPKYFVYQLQRIFSIKEKTARGSTIKTITKEEFTEFPITIPPLPEQERIVKILDRFDKLCNDISEGLPAEIEARQKQYEYYRGKLLTFKELTV